MQTIKYPLTDHYRAVLKQIAPHRLWHSVLLGVALAIASIAIWRDYEVDNREITYFVYISIVSIFWIFQFVMMHSAVTLANIHTLPDDLVGSASPKQLMRAKLWAVLHHHRRFIALMSVAMLGATVVLMLYSAYGTGYYQAPKNDLNLYFGIHFIGEHGISYKQLASSFEILHPLNHFSVFLIVAIIFISSLSKSALSVSIGLNAKRIRQALITQVTLIVGAFGLFLCVYWISLHLNLVNRPYSSYLQYGWKIGSLFSSLQAIIWSFFDSGLDMATGIYGCWKMFLTSSEIRVFNYQTRHIITTIITIGLHLWLSRWFLLRAAAASSKKKL